MPHDQHTHPHDRNRDHEHGAGGTHVHLDAEQPGVLGRRPGDALRVGVGGPVGSGKTALIAALCGTLRDELRLGVVTNDIYTTEDADFLRHHAVLGVDRIVAVETGACPHTAIRDDISPNLDAVEELEATQGPLVWCWWRVGATTSPPSSPRRWSTGRSS